METIREAQIKDLEQLKKLTDENIGADFYSAAYLLDAIENEDKKIFVCTDENDLPVAYLYLFTATFAEARKILKLQAPLPFPELEAMDIDAPVCVYKTTCTDRQYRKRGILRYLMDAAGNYFATLGIRYILLEAIRHPDGYTPAASTVEKHGFRPITAVLHPWSDIDSYCIYCKSRFCKCDAILYVKELD